MSLIDSAELVYVVLSNYSSLSTLITSSGRLQLFGPPGLPEDYGLCKSIMYLGNGGEGDREVPISREEYEFYCYGKDGAAARSVYLQLRSALHRQKNLSVSLSNGTGIFQYAQLISGPQDRSEPLEGWPYVYCSFMVHFIETTH